MNGFRRSLRLLAVAVAVAAAAIVASPSSASPFTVFTDEAAFLSALENSYTEGYESYSPGLQSSPMSFSGAGFSYTVSAPSDLWINGSGEEEPTFVPLIEIMGNQSLSTNESAEPITFDFTGSGQTINAVGGWFSPVDGDGNPVTGTIVLNVSDPWEFDLTFEEPGWAFYGFIDPTGPITALTVGISPPGGEVWPAVDNFTVGLGPLLVPEPAFYQLGALLALGGLGVLRLRKRA
jgi:hypothetical protein